MPLRGHEEALVSSALYHMAAILPVPDSCSSRKKKNTMIVSSCRGRRITLVFSFFLSFFLHWCFLWNTSTEFNQARSRVSINSQEMNKSISQGFPGDPVVKNPPCNARDPGSTPGPRRFHMLWSS